MNKIIALVLQSLNLYKYFGLKISAWYFCEHLPILRYRLIFTKKKQRLILQYLSERYMHVLNNHSEFVQGRYDEKTNFDAIWVFWMQGYDNAPDIIKACIKSIKENANGYPVVILDENNYRDYVEFPIYIEEKVRDGIISITHFSDILRCALLSKYKGVWMDATFLLTDKLPTEIMQSDFWSGKLSYDENIGSLSYYRWNLALMKSNRRLFGAMYELLLEYWEYENYMIDYFLLDYFLEMAYRQCSDYQYLISSIPENNPNIFRLAPLLNQSYNATQYKELQQDTIFFKLQRRTNVVSKTKEGKLTYFGYIMERYRNE